MSPTSTPIDESRPEAESAALWRRLRESVALLGEVGRHAADPAAMARRRAGRAAMLQRREDAGRREEGRRTLLWFNQGRERYAVPLEDVLEVQPLERFSPVPGAAEFLPGVVHWRGALLTLLDLGKLLGIREAGLGDLHVWIVVEAAARRVAVVAREVENLVTVSPGEIFDPPRDRPEIPQDWILGVHDENRLLVNLHEILRDSRLAAWRPA